MHAENEPVHYVAVGQCYLHISRTVFVTHKIYPVRFLFVRQWYGVAVECQWPVPVGIWPILPIMLLSQPPWARQLPNNIGLPMQAVGELGINGGRMTAFVDRRSLLPVLWNYEAPGIVWFYIGGIYFKRRASLMR